MSYKNGGAMPRESESRSPIVDWIANNLQTLIVASVLIGGWVANSAMMSARISDNELRTGKLEQRFDHDVVPRQEQEVRDRMLDQRLEQMQRTLDSIQQELRREMR